MTAFDCQRCGACCRDASCANGAIVLISDEEASLIPAMYRTRLTVIRMLPDEHGMAADATGRCAALAGEIGRDVSCEVYAVRPSICAKFEPGGSGCLRARAEAGIS